MSEYKEELHPRESDGKFASKSHDEQAGGLTTLAPTRVVICRDAVTRMADRLEQIDGLGGVSVRVREKHPEKAKLAVTVRGIEFHVDDSGKGDVLIWDSTPGATTHVPPVTVSDDGDLVDGFRRARERNGGYRAVAVADRAVLDAFGPEITRCDSREAEQVWGSTFHEFRDRLHEEDTAAGW